jgi:MerR family copper efflux transcriptional regulator
LSEQYLSVSEAAKMLGVSEKTVRRRIKAGDLLAELVPGPYGQQYRIPASAIQTAQEVVDVIQVDRPNDPRVLGMVVAQAVEEAVARQTAPLLQEIRALREQFGELAATVDTGPDVDQAILETAKENAVQAKLIAYEAVESLREERISAAAREQRLLDAIERLRTERRRPWWRFW